MVVVIGVAWDLKETVRTFHCVSVSRVALWQQMSAMCDLMWAIK